MEKENEGQFRKHDIRGKQGPALLGESLLRKSVSNIQLLIRGGASKGHLGLKQRGHLKGQAGPLALTHPPWCRPGSISHTGLCGMPPSTRPQGACYLGCQPECIQSPEPWWKHLGLLNVSLLGLSPQIK